MSHPAMPQTPACWFIFQHDHLLLMKNDSATPLTDFALVSTLQPYFLRQHALGVFQNYDCYCAEITVDTPLPDTLLPLSLKKSFELLGKDWFSEVVKAYSIINWDRNHQFCGRCGNLTVHKSGLFERVCTACGLALYPRISPSVIVLIKKGDQILMARSPHFSPGAYGLIAGFVEAGESLEDAVHREVMEEVSIKIRNLRYFGSQPWPFPDSLMTGFIADYESGEIILDHHEIESADWYSADRLPGRPSTNLSIAAKLIDYFVAGKIKD